jgi:hypothetical protein
LFDSFDSHPAIIGAREWGVNAEAGCSNVIAGRCEAKAVDKLWRILVAHAGSR